MGNEVLIEAVKTLQQRMYWLDARIEAKCKVGWDVEWDTKERDALRTIIDFTEGELYP